MQWRVFADSPLIICITSIKGGEKAEYHRERAGISGHRRSIETRPHRERDRARLRERGEAIYNADKFLFSFISAERPSWPSVALPRTGKRPSPRKRRRHWTSPPVRPKLPASSRRELKTKQDLQASYDVLDSYRLSAFRNGRSLNVIAVLCPN